jgi:hypothetical protein
MNKAELLHQIRKLSGTINEAQKILSELAKEIIGKEEVDPVEGDKYSGTLVRETDKALLVKLTKHQHENFWLPKKIVEWEDKGDYYEFTIPEWIMNEKLNKRL